jgi:DtxR family transcriptional regulator, Mn-dependent transcriptional regulator
MGSMETLSEATQEYLESIYWLYEAGIDRTQANLARALQVSQPSASEMLRRLADDDLVSRDDHKLIQFTERGREVAARIVARHRTVEAYLVKVMGIPWDDVHEEAHAMEHSISPRLESKMLEMIGEVRTCPHGHPIGDYPREPGEPVPAVPVGSVLVVLRLENEAEDLLHYLMDVGVRPGLTGVLAESGPDEVTITADGRAFTLTRSVAETVAVRADPSPPPRTALPEQLVLAKERYGR